jgi:hypothetical protein
MLIRVFFIISLVSYLMSTGIFSREIKQLEPDRDHSPVSITEFNNTSYIALLAPCLHGELSTGTTLHLPFNFLLQIPLITILRTVAI